MNFFWQGLKILCSKPKLWPACLAPTLFALIIDGFLCWILITSLSENIRQTLTQWGWQPPISIPVGRVLTWMIILIVSGPTFLIAFFSVSPVAFDRLSFQIERMQSSQQKFAEIKWSRLTVDLIARVVVAGCIAMISLIAALLGHPWVSAILTGIAIFLDMTAPACLRRGEMLWHQVGYLFRNPNAFFILGMVILVSWVPLLNIIIMPWLVATGTLYVSSLSHETEELT